MHTTTKSNALYKIYKNLINKQPHLKSYPSLARRIAYRIYKKQINR